MANFRFRLESVLKLRVAERDARRQQLAEAFEAEQILQQHADELQRETETMQAHRRDTSQPGEVDVGGLLDANRYDLILAARRQQLQQQKSQLEAEIERRRMALIEADRQVQVLDKLKARQAQAHRKNEDAKEIKQADELTQRQSAVRMQGR